MAGGPVSFGRQDQTGAQIRILILKQRDDLSEGAGYRRRCKFREFIEKVGIQNSPLATTRSYTLGFAALYLLYFGR